MNKYETIIGLEVHAEMKTLSKMFCGCSTKFGASPNTQTCPVCLGFPGVLPVINKQAVEFGIKTGLALHCEIASQSKMDRKNYFYPDLPKAFQISQYDKPLALKGYVEVEVNGAKKKIGITRLHLEEDAGKLVHTSKGGQIGAAEESLVDYNRGGVPLMEIVSEPDINSPEEAYQYLLSIKSILEYLEVSDCNMEEGSLRCDANISLRPVGQREFGAKVEIKNMNSFKNVRDALQYEVERQTKALDSGEKTHIETRLWDAGHGKTQLMRSKEEAHDYRYFPEPDLPPMAISREWAKELQATLPEMPEARKDRFVSQYGLPVYDAGVLTSSKALAVYCEATIKAGAPAKDASNWIMTELLAGLKESGKEIEQSPVSSQAMAGLIGLIKNGTLSGKLAKEVFKEMFSSGKLAEQVVKEKGLVQITDTDALSKVIDEVINANKQLVDEVRAGKDKGKGFLVGQIMKATQGKANPKIINELLENKLKG